MAKGRDRPRKEPKHKAKAKAPKSQPGQPAAGPIVPSYQPPMRQVEVIKPKRKEREPQDPSPQDEG